MWDNQIEGGDNILFTIEYKMSDSKKNEFTTEKERMVKGNVFISQHINGSRETNCNVNLKSDNVVSTNDGNLVNVLANLGETEINISHVSENSIDINNTEPISVLIIQKLKQKWYRKC